MAITSVPGLATARANAFAELARCAGEQPQSLREFEMADGTIRRTAAARTHGGVAESLLSDCAPLHAAVDPLRVLVDQASRRFLRVLEPLEEAWPMKTSDAWAVRDIAQRSLQLEHFHAYAPAATAPAESSPGSATDVTPTVPTHTDEGLFIAMVPAMRLGGNSDSADGFHVRRADGSLATLRPGLEANSLIFLLGESWVGAVNPHLRTPLRAAPHLMRMPPSPPTTDGPAMRLWYGRMYLFPRDGPGTDLAAPSEKLVVADAESQPVGCRTGQRRILLDDDGCPPGTIECWHTCMDVTDLECGRDAKCVDPQGYEWKGTADETDHCTACEPSCDLPERGEFCDGVGTDMLMSGFAFSRTDCLILLFGPWLLDTAGKFAGAVLGTVILGVATELLTWTRRRCHVAPRLLSRPHAWRAVMALLYLVQVTLGYFLMLIAMTYSAELFMAVIVGLGVGHVALNLAAPVGEKTDACCCEPIPDDPGRRTLPAIGATPAPRVVALSVEGMTCAGCPPKVEAALRSVEGVADVTCDLEEGSATVRCDNSTRVNALVAAVATTGKSATPTDDAPSRQNGSSHTVKLNGTAPSNGTPAF